MSPIQRQRLIDGEISHRERADLLNGLDKDPGQWRVLALELLEELVWIQQLPKSAQTHPSQDSFPTSQQSTLQTTLQKAVHADRSLDKASSTSWGLRQVGVLATAAALLLALGWFVGRHPSFNHLQPTPQPGQYTAAKPPLTPQTEDQGDVPQQWATNSLPLGRSSMRMQVQGENQFAHEIPLLDAKEFDPKLVLANEALEFAKLNQQLKRKGYQLDVQPQYLSGNLDDGRKILVPVHNVSLKPYGL